MRSDEERKAELHRRAAEYKYKRRVRQEMIIGIVGAAACFAVVIALAAAMPALMDGIAAFPAASGSMRASIFSENGALGYIVIGIIAFLLGISTALLCFRVRKWRHNERKKPEDNNDRDH